VNDSENPFANPDKPIPSVPRGTIVAWSVAVVMLMTALFFVMLWAQARTNHRHEMEALRGQLDKASDDLANAVAESKTNRDLIASLQNAVADLQKEKEMAGQMAKNLEDEMRKDLESKDVAITKLQGKLTVTILDRVMFDSGEAVLKPDGQAVMQKVAGLLAKHPEIKIHVIGHTDNVPIRTRYASNWELSTARALAAVHFLTEQGGVDPRRVGAVGYGEYRPIADNSTAEGRAQNRRIAITILPDELALADTKPAKKPAPAILAPESAPMQPPLAQ
jgi:chemotaxis protein MotB